MIGLIGDIHTMDRNLELALSALSDCEFIACVGDIVDGPGDVHRTFTLLKEAGVRAVLGNHDQWCLEGSNLSLNDATRFEDLTPPELAYLRELPKTLSLGERILLCHGIGENNMAKVAADDYGYALENNEPLQHFLRNKSYDLLVNGHTHRRMVAKFSGKTIIGVGSLLHDPCCAKLDSGRRSIQFFDIGDGIFPAESFHY